MQSGKRSERPAKVSDVRWATNELRSDRFNELKPFEFDRLTVIHSTNDVRHSYNKPHKPHAGHPLCRVAC